MHQILGKQVRIISKKEEDKDVSGNLSVLSVVLSTNELFVSRKPSAKPNLLAWEVISSESTPGAVKFKNVQTGTFLTSSLPHYNVTVGEDAGVESDWQLFAKSGTTLLPFTADFVALGDVWIQNAKTKGFLSVRSNEGMRMTMRECVNVDDFFFVSYFDLISVSYFFVHSCFNFWHSFHT
jgi:hypothetical protein